MLMRESVAVRVKLFLLSVDHHTERSISVRTTPGTRPYPATIRAARLVNLRPKSFSNLCDGTYL
jgi:hypothetical protein